MPYCYVAALAFGCGVLLEDAPKGMAEVAGRPFLELLLRQLRRHGFERAILAVGYQKDADPLAFWRASIRPAPGILSRVMPTRNGRCIAQRCRPD